VSAKEFDYYWTDKAAKAVLDAGISQAEVYAALRSSLQYVKEFGDLLIIVMGMVGTTDDVIAVFCERTAGIRPKVRYNIIGARRLTNSELEQWKRWVL
jgi:uncharacterized DUF497 family protein